MKRKTNKYFRKKSSKFLKLKPKKKEHKSIYIKTLDAFNPRERSLDMTNPYIQVTPQKSTALENERTSKWSLRSTSKPMSQIRRSEAKKPSSVKSRLFGRPSEQLEEYKKLILESEKASTKATTLTKDKERGKSTLIRRKAYQPPIKKYELPTDNPLFNQTFYKNESQKLLENSFDWKKAGNTRHIQTRIQKRIKYLVYVRKEDKSEASANSRKIYRSSTNFLPTPSDRVKLRKKFIRKHKKNLLFDQNKSCGR
ncbi:unnamed protein product [Moneuplotes crassus]|uniref:Uncharacterized protein n=1 Tax=Euplotes crassus TaxID=5936 RepID=A0AAD2DAQ2_EUPCR|nr:unnamed protein product [Moneuplotes crassus]